jgi:hypothetical protein
MRSVLFVVALAGCGATIRTSVAPTANLGQYHTFAFAPPPQGQPVTLVDQTIESAVRRDLAAKGLAEAAPGQPADFHVAYHVKTEQKIESYPVGYGYWGYGGMSINEYTQGTLILAFVDPHTNQVFWRGTASDVVNHPESPDLQKVDQVVGQVIEKYPMVAAAPRTTM